MIKKIFNFILLWVGLVVCSSLTQAATNLFPTGSILSTNIVLPGQSPGPEDDTNVDVFVPDIDARFPIAIVLQGGLVNASQYSEFGRQLARHGFLVAIPNRLSLLGPPPPVPFPDQIVVLEVLAQLDVENGDPTSPLHQQVDSERMGIVGHSVGGFVGLLVIEGSCVQPFCFGGFQRPAALQAGAFYGTNSIDPFSGQLIDIDTGAIPVALVQGSQDGVSTPDDGQATFDILDGPRELITIDGANHFGITNDNPPPGAIPDFSPQLTSQSKSIQQIADSIGDYFSNNVKEESTSIIDVFVDQDAWLKQAAPSDNFGDEKELPVKNKPGDNERAVFRFDLTDIPQFSEIRSATATFRVTTPDNRPINIFRIVDSWTESTVNWGNTGNDIDGSTIHSSFTPSSDDSFVSVDLTPLIQDWVCGTPNHGLMFVATSDDEQSKYHSKEEDISNSRPFMTVEAGSGPFPCDSAP